MVGNTDTVRKFLQREIAFSRSTDVLDADSRIADDKSPKLELPGFTFSAITDLTMRSGVKSVILRFDDEDLLLLWINKEDVLDINTIANRQIPVHSRDVNVTSIDDSGEIHVRKALAGSPRHSAVAYVIANNMNALRRIDRSNSIPLNTETVKTSPLVRLSVEVLVLNAEKSKSPDNFLATLKQAVRMTKHQMVSAEMRAEAEYARRNKGGYER